MSTVVSTRRSGSRALCSFLLCGLLLASIDRAKALEEESPASTDSSLFGSQVYPILKRACLRCHGAKKQKGGLRLDSRSALLEGGESGPALDPNDLAASLFLKSILYTDDDLQMPPKGKLPAGEIAVLRRWILNGAQQYSATEESAFTAEDRAYWAFQPLAESQPPRVKDVAWVNAPVDAFILERLEKENLDPAPPATKHVLARRLYFDLVGLPPSPDELAAFVEDLSPYAYEKLVDRLLSSPRYGERWGRHWLDLVRYADSEGFRRDAYRPLAWRYRDYVVRAFNRDTPYDRFVTEQIAGDELTPYDRDAVLGTGYLRMWPYEYNQVDIPKQLSEILNDITDVTAEVFLGLGMSCARCHDHKFDPILQQDYFRLQAFFSAIMPYRSIVQGSPAEKRAQEMQQAEWLLATHDLREKLSALEAPHIEWCWERSLGRFPEAVKDLLSADFNTLSPLRQQLYDLAYRQVLNDRRRFLKKRFTGEEKKRRDELKKLLASFDHLKPKEIRALTIVDVGAIAPPTVVGGRTSRPGAAMSTENVPPGYLAILEGQPLGESLWAEIDLLPGNPTTTGRRSVLARWLTRPDNQLTARALVNRLWQYHFGRGLVATANDFGSQGEPPSHPQLLDWLARELVRRGWSFKSMHRMLVTSNTYRQGAAPEMDRERADLAARLFGSNGTRRLAAELIRDAALDASGELVTAIGGPSEESASLRRALYVQLKRNRPDPMLSAFDAPLGTESCARRNVTTTAPQALLLLNNEWILARAKAFAERVRSGASTGAWDVERIVRRAYRTAFGRAPTDDEITAAVAFLERQSGEIIATLGTDGPRLDEARQTALVDFCHALLGSNEFVYVD